MTCRLRTLTCVVIFSIAFCGNDLHAQPTATGFRALLEKLPAVVAGDESDEQLLKLRPDDIDATADINAIESQLTAYFNSIRGGDPSRSSNDATSTTAVNTQYAQANTDATRSTSHTFAATPQSLPKVSADSIIALVRILQDEGYRFMVAGKAIESAFAERVAAAEEHAHAKQQSEPCAGSIDCFKAHRRIRNLELVAAERRRLSAYADLVTKERHTLGPMLSTVDAVLPRAIWTVNHDERKWYNVLGTDALSLVTQVAEQIKLNRIYRAHTCRLLHEGFDR